MRAFELSDVWREREVSLLNSYSGFELYDTSFIVIDTDLAEGCNMQLSSLTSHSVCLLYAVLILTNHGSR